MIETQPSKILQSFFGFNQFKGQQKECIESILQGKDVFIVMPTGGGKSLCYQIPSLILNGTHLDTFSVPASARTLHIE